MGLRCRWRAFPQPHINKKNQGGPADGSDPTARGVRRRVARRHAGRMSPAATPLGAAVRAAFEEHSVLVFPLSQCACLAAAVIRHPPIAIRPAALAVEQIDRRPVLRRRLDRLPLVSRAALAGAPRRWTGVGGATRSWSSVWRHRACDASSSTSPARTASSSTQVAHRAGCIARSRAAADAGAVNR